MRKSEKLFNGITDIDDQILAEVDNIRKSSKLIKFKVIEKVAIVIAAVLLLGGGTVIAASPNIRKAIINFFSGGNKEEIPIEHLDEFSSEENTAGRESSELFDSIAMDCGDIHVIKDKEADEHIIATYISSDMYLDMERTLGGGYLISTTDSENDQRDLYRINENDIDVLESDIYTKNCTMQIKNLPGLSGNDYKNLILPEMSFEIRWQKFGDKIVMLPIDEYSGFDIGNTFGGTKDGKSIEGMYDGSIYTVPVKNETKWVEVKFTIDYQRTNYSYPILFNIETGEVRDIIADIDLSGYNCLCDLEMVDMSKAVAMAGDSIDNLYEISIDLENGIVTENGSIDATVENCYMSVQTSPETVFYLTGTEESSSGYIYNKTDDCTTELFRNAAVGYSWEEGFADTYIELIGHNYALFYDELNNEVFLMSMVTGEMNLLQGIPADHDISYLFDASGKSLCIEFYSENGASKIALYNTENENGWYFDRKLPKDVGEVSSYWYDDKTYCINAKSDAKYYLYIYEYFLE